MVNYPEVQQKAQEEIDRVVGQNRLPTFEDRDSLPYVFAVFKETLRWHNVAPLGNLIDFVFFSTELNVSCVGLAHLLKEDDVYNGFLLPAKSTVMANIW